MMATVISTEGQSAVTFVYVDSTQGWLNTVTGFQLLDVRGVSPPFIVATCVSGACNTLATAPDCANAQNCNFFRSWYISQCI